MKKLLGFTSLILFAPSVFAADPGIELPSSVPIEAFDLKPDQRGYGYIQSNVELVVMDDYYGDKIGDVAFHSHGAMYTTPSDELGWLGRKFEDSFTFGIVSGELKKTAFTFNNNSYNNSYDKSGFYLGYRPAYEVKFVNRDTFKFKASTAMHWQAYYLSGDFSVMKNNDPNFPNSYRYDEVSYGVALKPTFSLQGTYYPTKNLSLTAFAGLTTFVTATFTTYDDGKLDSGDELTANMANIDPVVGYDITYNAPVYGMFNFSTMLSQRAEDSAVEMTARYVAPF